MAGRGWNRCAKEHLREQCEEHEIVENRVFRVAEVGKKHEKQCRG